MIPRFPRLPRSRACRGGHQRRRAVQHRLDPGRIDVPHRHHAPPPSADRTRPGPAQPMFCTAVRARDCVVPAVSSLRIIVVFTRLMIARTSCEADFHRCSTTA